MIMDYVTPSTRQTRVSFPAVFEHQQRGDSGLRNQEWMREIRVNQSGSVALSAEEVRGRRNASY